MFNNLKKSIMYTLCHIVPEVGCRWTTRQDSTYGRLTDASPSVFSACQSFCLSVPSPYHTIPCHTIPYRTVPYHTMTYMPHLLFPFHPILSAFLSGLSQWVSIHAFAPSEQEVSWNDVDKKFGFFILVLK